MRYAATVVRAPSRDTPSSPTKIMLPIPITPYGRVPNGDVHINAAAGQPIGFRQNGTSIRMGISSAGNVVVGSQADLPGAGAALLQVAGEAFKLTPGQNTWVTPSDGQLNNNVQDLDLG